MSNVARNFSAKRTRQSCMVSQGVRSEKYIHTLIHYILKSLITTEAYA